MKSQEEIEASQQHRSMMYAVNRNLTLIFWGYIVLTAVFIILGVAASAIQASDNNNVGPAKWYYGFEAGALEMMAGVVTLILTFLFASKSRLCAYILLGFHAILFALAVTGVLVTFTNINIIPTVLGVLLGCWGQFQFSKLEYLKQQKGYPHFSANADEPAHYDSLYHVRRAQQPGDAMDRVGDADSSRRYQHDRAHNPDVSEESLGIGDMLDGKAPQGTAAPSVPQPAAGIALDTMTADAGSGRTEMQPEPAHDVLLDDMTAEGSAHTKQYAPDADALSTPEEVRARLAAMKQAKQNPPQ